MPHTIPNNNLLLETSFHMAYLSCKRKLKPVRRAWRSFTSNLRSRLRSLDVPTRIKTASSLLLGFFLRWILVPFRSRFLKKRPSDRYRRQLYKSQYQPYRATYRAIYIDKLYRDQEEERFRRSQEQGGASKGKEVSAKEKVTEKQKGLESIEDAWRVVVASSPHLRVDERAEEFIKKIRKEMRMEKERSLLEYQEMMNRSAR